MKLSDHQANHALNIALLIQFAYGRGMRLRRGNWLRSDEEQARLRAAGKSKVRRSLHQDGLATDFALDKLINGKWVYQRSTAAYEPLGDFWESLSPLNVWGGRFPLYFGGSFYDGNHFETRIAGRPKPQVTARPLVLPVD